MGEHPLAATTRRVAARGSNRHHDCPVSRLCCRGRLDANEANAWAAERNLTLIPIEP